MVAILSRGRRFKLFGENINLVTTAPLSELLQHISNQGLPEKISFSDPFYIK